MSGVFADVMGFLAPVDMSKANAALGSAMGITRCPCCQVFRGMKVLHSLTHCSTEAFAAAVAGCSSTPAAAADHGASNGHPEGAANGESATGGPAAGPATQLEGTASGGSVFEPPTGKEARAGAVRMMPNGKSGSFW